MQKSLLETIDGLLLEAISRNASCIRIRYNPKMNELQLWESIDHGPLVLRTILGDRWATSIISRLKIMGGMFVSEHRRVQQGFYNFTFGTELSKTNKLIGIICLPTIPDDGSGDEIVLILKS